MGLGDIPAATAEDVNVAVEAAQKAFTRNKGKDWSAASGAYRAKFLRAIAAKVHLVWLFLVIYEFIMNLVCLNDLWVPLRNEPGWFEGTYKQLSI